MTSAKGDKSSSFKFVQELHLPDRNLYLSIPSHLKVSMVKTKPPMLRTSTFTCLTYIFLITLLDGLDIIIDHLLPVTSNVTLCQLSQATLEIYL